MCVGDLIRQKRQELNLSQEELGRMVGVNRAAINKWESGRVKNLKRETLKKLSEIFNISPALLVEPESTSQQIGGFQQLTQAEERLLHSFRDLNEFGQEAAITMLDGLSSNPAYIKKCPAPTLDKKQA